MCPVCNAHLQSTNRALACVGCRRAWPQTADFADVFVNDQTPPGSRWAQRQDLMAASYRDLIADPPHAVRAYHHDFDPYVAPLSACSGRILDIGGGNGLVRHFLPPDVDYVSLDPCTEWLEESWDVLGEDFPCLRQPLQFVRGVAEHIPFADGSYDVVLAFWSLNHCADPQRSLCEIARVLRPGGRCLLVLEDVEPAWRDILNGSYRDWRSWSRRRCALEKCKAVLIGWPLQSDHLRIRETDVARWGGGLFSTIHRAWHGSYLTLDCVSTTRPPQAREGHRPTGA